MSKYFYILVYGYFYTRNYGFVIIVMLMMMKNEYTYRFKFLFFDIGILLLISFASFAGNFQWKRIYWLAEMPVFIFVLALSVLGTVFLSLKGPEKIRWGVADYLVISYFVYLVTRAFISYYPGLPTDRIWVIIASLLFYFLLRGFRSVGLTSNSFRIIQGVTYLAAFHAIVAILQRMALLPSYDNSQKIAGLFSNPGLFGCFLAIGVCLCLVIILNTKSLRKKLTSLFLILLILTGLFLSGSRTAWIAVFIPCALIFLDYYLKGKQKIRKTLLSCIILLFTFFSGLYLYKMNIASIDGRMLIWKIGWGMFKDQPTFGMGFGNFYTEYGNYQANYFFSGTRPQEEILTASMNYYAFSEPLNLLIEEGMAGAVLFSAMTTYTIFQALRFNDGRYWNLKMAVLSIMAVLLIFGIFSYPFQDLFFNLLFMLSISIIADNVSSVERQRSTLLPGRFWRSGMIVLLLITGGYAIIKLQAVYTWKMAKEKILVSEGDALASYNRAYGLLANNGAFLFNYGSELAALGQYQQALKILQRATRYGNSVELHLQLGNIYQALGQLKEAERSLLRASAMNPKLFLPLSKLMLFYKETGQYEKCGEIARQIIRKPVKVNSEIIGSIKKLAALNIKQL